ncbi:MAG: hypothetical protein LBD94_02855 [Rickettsiales bacterium]|jgi:hypothetical protein|nr:hypothetical protein [Rickettsiales bacterium]
MKKWKIFALVAASLAVGVFAGMHVDRIYFSGIQLSEYECNRIKDKIINPKDKPDGYWQRLYKGSCGKMKEASNYTTNKLPSETCAAIEILLLGELKLIGENSFDVSDHFARAKYFEALAKQGCAENAEQYKKSALREIDLTLAIVPFSNGIDTYQWIDIYKIYSAFQQDSGKLDRFIQSYYSEDIKAALFQEIWNAMK